MTIFVEDLRELFSYDPNSGVITRKVQQGNYPAGSICKAKLGDYLKVKVYGKDVLQHRLAWYLHYGTQPPAQLDHRDLDKQNNRISNLRASDASTNQMNIAVHKRSQTGIKGIMPVRGGTMYRAEVCVEGKRYQKHSKSIAVLQLWLESKRVELHNEFTRH